MREILFRGKRVDNGEWVQGDLLQNVNCLKIREQEKDIKHIARSFAVIPETVGQYMSLIDKNGIKIFEGDILEYQYHLRDGNKKPFRAEVKAEIMSFGAYHKVYGFCAYLEFGDMENSEIIGNIHDNPELLSTPQNDEVRE